MAPPTVGSLRIPLLVISLLILLPALVLNWKRLPILGVLLNQNYLSSTPVVTNPHTKISYRGTATNYVEHFQNIFYAEDTSGRNRFAPPVPYLPPPGTIVDATRAGAWCPQGTGPPPLPFTSPITNISENCLSLRIARPMGTEPSAKFPVLVWIHGGGNALGSGYDQLYQPDGLVQQAKLNGQPVIWVAINYRLGIFGYATSKALREAKSANAGLRDQRAAFEWIRDNIGAFGGDPENVVAIGQSVGGLAIGLHLVSYQGKHGVPFQKAMMMSGASGTNFNVQSDFVANNTATVAKSLGCTTNSDSEATIECLRDIPLETLNNASVALARGMHPPFGELVFYSSYDGDIIPDRPSNLLRKGAFVKNVDLVASWVANEGAWYALPTLTNDASVLASFSAYVLGLSDTSKQKLLSLYPISDFTHLVRDDVEATAQYYRAAQINRDLWFACPVLDFTWQYSRHSRSSNIRLYEMNQTKFGPILQYMGVPQWRVSHLSDIPFMLNNDVAAGGDNSVNQQKISRMLSGSAAAFAHTGDPTRSDGEVLKDWLEAYGGSIMTGHAESYPESLNLHVIGGPYGTGTSTLKRKGNGNGKSDRDRAVEWEKLFERCDFINSIQEEIGV